ncbi:lactoferrin/transferrin family TonB-dependent receptor [Neisseria animaloris]|uniref:lactoferrin/transferrin family TonB-dependent receptor n=1 Tax=Neisseria animaloris TaxID=326522 RepID=UPI0039E1F9A5
MFTTHSSSQQKIIVTALSLCFTAFSGNLYAADQAQAESTVDLDTVYVTAPKKINRKTQEVTGLGKVVKNAEQLEKEQVLNIRDLVRYDPGISVVEQGRGGSSGFSIRGVDKNRVQVSVDGIPQLQSYADTTSSSGGSGSMNEIEYENVSAVEISKGSNSVESGSGSLGGSVNYRTKNVGDFLQDGEKWGLTSKSVYSSKDKRFAQTLGGAFSYQGFEGLLQYTHRKGNEIDIHKDAGNANQSFYKQDVYEDKYDLRGAPGLLSDNMFRFEDEPDVIRHKSAPTRPDLWQPQSRTEPFTPEEEAQRRHAMRHKKETVSAKEYTGANRIRPNPMEYRSGSWLARLGYHISPQHHIGWLTEHTKQNYDSRDMRYPSYYPPSSKPLFELNDNGVWRNDLREGYSKLLWSRARFLQERHSKMRNGIAYRYKPQEGGTWADALELSIDRQNIKTDTGTVHAHCSRYPDYSTTLNCAPSKDKPGSFLSEEQIDYTENHTLFNTKWNKKWQWGRSKHDIQIAAGYDHFDSSFAKAFRETSAQKNQVRIGTETRVINGQKRVIDIYKDLGTVITDVYPCIDWKIETCSRKPIKGNSYYLALRDNMALGKYIDLGLGLRLDNHSFRSDDVAIKDKNYTNRSWNAGLVIKPNSRWAVSYRVSNGFRVPSFQELYGYNVPGIPRDSKVHYVADLEPEKSFNQEFGLTFKGNFGNIELSMFNSRYRDLIAYAITKTDKNNYQNIGNFNLQNTDLNGINIRSSIDLNGMWSKLPEGLSLNMAYNRIKAKRLFNNHPERYTWLADYPLETIQPSRYVLGLNYDAPSEKWGMSMNWIHSRGKNPQELISKAYSDTGPTINRAVTKAATKPWTTVDLIGYYRPWKKATLRAGIYNAMNYRYLTWETVRQSSINSLSQQKVPGSDYKQFAAPGRNITVGFEMKF